MSLQGVLLTAAAVTTVIVATNTLMSWRPLLWVVRRLVVGPMTDALHRDLDQRLAPLWTALEEIRREVTTNGGSSLKDVVGSTATQVDRVADEVADLAAQQIGLKRDMERITDVLRASLSPSVQKPHQETNQ